MSSRKLSSRTPRSLPSCGTDRIFSSPPCKAGWSTPTLHPAKVPLLGMERADVRRKMLALQPSEAAQARDGNTESDTGTDSRTSPIQ